MPRRRLLACAVLAGLANVGVAASVDLDVADIERALKLARSSEAERGRFHAPYQIPVAEPLVERLEVITEYRRLVLIAEQRLAAGDWTFASSVRAAEEALRPWKQKLTIRARIRFHPQATYTKVPAVAIMLSEESGSLPPIHVTTDPQYALRGPSTGAPPLIGVVVEAIFDASAVGKRTLAISLLGPGMLDVRQTVDFGLLR